MFGWLTPVHADSAALRAVGSGLVPVADQIPPVIMERERVDVHLFPMVAVVDASFDMLNEGPELELEVGFPSFGAPAFFEAIDVGLMDFSVKVDGVPVAHVERRMENRAFPLWRAWQQRFRASGRSRIEVRYWTPLWGYNGISRLPFTYVLRTGRFWKGPIGDAVVCIHATGIPVRAIREATPDGYRLETGSLTWTWRSLVPERDVAVLISLFDIVAAHLGLGELDDVADVLAARPPVGTPVLLGGWSPIFLLDAEGKRPHEGESVLAGERHSDHNIVVPDGIAPHDPRGGDSTAAVREAGHRLESPAEEQG